GLPQAAQSGVEPRGARSFPSRREQGGRRGTVRVSRDLHDTSVAARAGAASAPRTGAPRIRGSGEEGPAAGAASPGAARGDDVPLAEGDARLRGDLPSAALAAPGGGAPAARRAAASGGGDRRAHAGGLGGE